MQYEIINTKTGEIVAITDNPAYARLIAQALRVEYREQDFQVRQ